MQLRSEAEREEEEIFFKNHFEKCIGDGKQSLDFVSQQEMERRKLPPMRGHEAPLVKSVTSFNHSYHSIHIETASSGTGTRQNQTVGFTSAENRNIFCLFLKCPTLA